jgi:hypothetical protein
VSRGCNNNRCTTRRMDGRFLTAAAIGVTSSLIVFVSFASAKNFYLCTGEGPSHYPIPPAEMRCVTETRELSHDNRGSIQHEDDYDLPSGFTFIPGTALGHAEGHGFIIRTHGSIRILTSFIAFGMLAVRGPLVKAATTSVIAKC